MYGLAAIVLLGVRYLVLPRVDDWRPRIEHYASQALGVRVTIGQIKADWQGLNPRLDLSSIQVYDGQEVPVLNLPAVSAVLGWRSIFALEPRLLSLKIDHPVLTLRLDPANRLWVAGQSVDLNNLESKGNSDHVALDWLRTQRELSIQNATVNWLDEKRQAPALQLQNVDLLIRNGRLSHRFALQASPPAALAQRLDVRGEFNRGLFSIDPSKSANWSGQVYVATEDVQPNAWSPWLNMPQIEGRASARAWFQLEHGKLTELDADAAVRGLAWTDTADGSAIQVAAGQLRVQGLPGDLAQFDSIKLGQSKNATGMSVKGLLAQAKFTLPGVFEDPILMARSISLDASIRRPPSKPLTVDLRKFQVVNDDLDIRLQGQWRNEGKTAAGTADVHGLMARGSMSAIHRYLPLEVNADARTWLSTGLLAGDIHNAAITLKGDLDDFPFSKPDEPGDFVLAGAYIAAKVDYAPARRQHKGWPMLENMSGNFTIDKVSLKLDSPGGGFAQVGKGRTLNLGAVTASIPDMENHSKLFVDGVTFGAVPGYLALAANTPLGGLLDGALDEAQGTGDWTVLMKLQVPLLNTDDTTIEGQIAFSDNTFSFMPEMPFLSQLRGHLDFSDAGVRSKDMRGQFLGGPVKISGELMKPNDALRFDGTLAGSGLLQLSRAPSMSRFSGNAAYRGHLGYQKGGSVEISVESDLTGMAINMPAPVGKTAAASQLFKAQWGGATDQGTRGRRWLTASLGDTVNVLLERDPSDAARSYFARGAVGLNRPASLPDRGLSLSATLPALDMDTWQTVIDGFTAPAGKSPLKGVGGGRPLFPEPNRVSLTTGTLITNGFSLHDLTLYATRPEPTQWRVNIESRQAAGTLEWREASGAIAGQITARLKHLALGGAEDTNTAEKTLSSGNDLADIPAIDLQAKTFSLYGKDLGELQVTGTNLERGRLWRLDKLQISNADAMLNATGNWRLDGPARGLSVDAAVKFLNLGKFMTRIGVDRVLSDGTGTMQGNLTWRDLPWTHSIANIDGQAQISLDKGRFMNVNSRTARLLELLSLQSLQRLARLDLNPSNLLRDGFPFDTIRGDMKLSQGVISTEGYKVTGPVATIVLAGTTSIIDERWDMKAVVIPNLDASGAAIVTALAVNPLIGLGAFVTQWLLKQPLARAMTLEYAVTGSWDDPKVAPAQSITGQASSAAKRDHVEH